MFSYKTGSFRDIIKERNQIIKKYENKIDKISKKRDKELERHGMNNIIKCYCGCVVNSDFSTVAEVVDKDLYQYECPKCGTLINVNFIKNPGKSTIISYIINDIIIPVEPMDRDYYSESLIKRYRKISSLDNINNKFNKDLRQLIVKRDQRLKMNGFKNCEYCKICQNNISSPNVETLFEGNDKIIYCDCGARHIYSITDGEYKFKSVTYIEK